MGNGNSDGMHDAYQDLAAESGWGPCAECGEWGDLTGMVEYDHFYYHPACIDQGVQPEQPLPKGA